MRPETRTATAWGIGIAVWAVVAVGSHLALPPLEQALPESGAGFLPVDAASHIAAEEFADAFGEGEVSAAVLIVRRPAGLTDDDRAFLRRLTESLEARTRRPKPLPAGDDWPLSVRSPESDAARAQPLLREKLLSPDGKAAVVQIRLPYDIVSIHTVNAVARPDKEHEAFDPARPPDLGDLIAAAGPPIGLEHHITGSAGLGRDYAVASKDGLDATLLYTLLGIVAVLLFVYRSPAAMIISLVTVSVSVAVSFRAASGMALLHLPVSATAKQFLIVLLYGVGTDFCLFVFARYREELAADEALHGPADRAGRRRAMARALARVGPAIIASAATVSVALGMMVFARFRAFSSAGPALAVGVLIATAAAITLAPTLMLACGRGLFWPGRVAVGAGAFGGVWRRAGVLPGRFPVASVVITLAAFAPFWLVARNTPQIFDSLQDLPPTADSVRGAAMFREHFPPGEAFPIAVLVRTHAAFAKTGQPPSGNLRSAADKITAAVRAMPHVSDVRGLTDPFGAGSLARLERQFPVRIPAFLPDALRTRAEREARLLRDDVIALQSAREYVGRDGRSLRMEVILDVGPYTNEAMDALRDLPGVIAAAADGTPLADPAVHALGATAIMADIRTVTGEDLVRVALLVAAALLVILLILLRDFPLSVILILATAAGYFATLGLAALVGHHVFGLTGLDWKVEFFLFCILVAVGQDYNILIVSRILEESADPALTGRAGPALAARRAIMRTGGIISCCGVVMAVTFGSMMAAPLLVMRQIGFALAAGVLIDTFVIRPLLVPAAYVLLERARRRPAPTRTA